MTRVHRNAVTLPIHLLVRGGQHKPSTDTVDTGDSRFDLIAGGSSRSVNETTACRIIEDYVTRLYWRIVSDFSGILQPVTDVLARGADFRIAGRVAATSLLSKKAVPKVYFDVVIEGMVFVGHLILNTDPSEEDVDQMAVCTIRWTLRDASRGMVIDTPLPLKV